MRIESGVVSLLLLACPVACISWTVTHEELLREFRDWCEARSRATDRLVPQKFYYVFTCEYCFSHWVAALVVVVTRYQLLYSDWRGYLVAGFSLVWIANLYMALFGRIRLDIKHEKLQIATKEAGLEERGSA